MITSANNCSCCFGEGTLRCSACKIEYYCSKECQNTDWETHKLVCRLFRQATLNPNAKKSSISAFYLIQKKGNIWKEVIQIAKAVFSAQLPNDWLHPSEIKRQELSNAICASMSDINFQESSRANLSISSCSNQRERQDLGNLGDTLILHKELLLNLEKPLELNYDVPFCGSINRFLFAYFSYVYSWPNQKQPEIEMINFQTNQEESHCIVIINREKKSDINDPTSYGKEAFILDAYEDEEALQFYSAKKIPNYGTLAFITRKGSGARGEILLHNRPIHQKTNAPQEYVSYYKKEQFQTIRRIILSIKGLIEKRIPTQKDKRAFT